MELLLNNPQWLGLHPLRRMTLGGTELMGSDVPLDRFEPMRSVYLSQAVDSVEEAERIYTVLSEGGQIFMPMQETFFAFRFGMLRDKFGTLDGHLRTPERRLIRTLPISVFVVRERFIASRRPIGPPE